MGAPITVHVAIPADIDVFERWVAEALAGHPEEHAQYRTGKTKLLIFFVGLVRKLSGSKVGSRHA